jgi:hypothetical protein
MTAHILDISGLILSACWMIGFSLVIRRWYLALIVAGFGFWAILDGTGRLIVRLDPLRDWSPSDTIWTNLGWLLGLAISATLILLKALTLRIIAPRKQRKAHTSS